MRELTGHKVNPANDTLRIEVQDEPGAGGAYHRYRIDGFDVRSNKSMGLSYQYPGPFTNVTLLFQNGPIGDVGINGITHEALLAILIDRLESFQAGPYASPYNQTALDSLKVAQEALLARTRHRMARGVEGTHTV